MIINCCSHSLLELNEKYLNSLLLLFLLNEVGLKTFKLGKIIHYGCFSPSLLHCQALERNISLGYSVLNQLYSFLWFVSLYLENPQKKFLLIIHFASFIQFSFIQKIPEKEFLLVASTSSFCIQLILFLSITIVPCSPCFSAVTFLSFLVEQGHLVEEVESCGDLVPWAVMWSIWEAGNKIILKARKCIKRQWS